MNEVASFDFNFKIISNYLNGDEISLIDLSKALQNFRKSISFNWFTQLLQRDHIKYMTIIWKALFQLVSNDDPGIRLSTFNTLGALVYSLCPFIPRTMVISFLFSVQDQAINKHISIAVIACFCHISNYVSPLDVDSFISKLPIVQHFSREIEDYLKYLPKLFSIMNPLDTEFLRLLLRTMLIKFGDKPSLNFIKAIIELIKHNPSLLIPDLMQYINHKSLKLTMLMLSPALLNSPKSKSFFDQQSKNELFNLALLTISQSNPSISEFEQACSTLSIIVEQTSNHSDAIKQIDKIKEALPKNLPKHLKILTLPFENNIEKITPKESDSLSVQTSKILSLSKLLLRSPTLENFSIILPIFKTFMNSEGEIFSKFIEALSEIFSIISLDFFLLNKSDSLLPSVVNDLKIILNHFLTSPTLNWVNNISLLHLIEFIKIGVGNFLINDYGNKVLKIVLNFCLSKQKQLSSAAQDVLLKIFHKSNVSFLLKYIYEEVDIFDDFVLYKLFSIINKISDMIGIELFESLKDISMEIIVMNKSIQTASEVFIFVNKLHSPKKEEDKNQKLNQIENEVKLICFDLIGRIFKSFTGIDPQIPTLLPPLPSTFMETDILSRHFDDQAYQLNTIQQCLIYLNQNQIFDNKLIELSIRLIKIFPKESLQILMRNDKSQFIGTNSFFILLLDIIQSTPSISIASECIYSLCNSPQNITIPYSILKQESNSVSNQLGSCSSFYEIIMQFISKKLIKKGKDKFNFLSFLEIFLEYDNQSLPEIKLSEKEEALFQFLKRNDKIGFVNQLDFEAWPLFDNQFCDFINENQKLISNTKISFQDLNETSIQFIGQNQTIFDESIIKYIHDNYASLYKQLFINEEHYLHILPNDLQNLTSISSLSPLIHRDRKIIFSKQIFHNFFKLSYDRISNEKFNEILRIMFDGNNSKIDEELDNALDFAMRNNFIIDEENIKQFLKFTCCHKNLVSYLTTHDFNITNYFPEQDIITSLDVPLLKKLFSNQCKELDASIQCNPMKYFKFYTQNYSFKTKNTIFLIYLILNCNISDETTSNFLMNQLSNISLISNIKQLLYFLRLFEVFLSQIYQKCLNNKEYINSISFLSDLLGNLIENISFLKDSQHASVHKEVSALFCWLSLFIKPNEKVKQYIDTCTKQYGNLSIFYPPSFLCISMGSIYPNFATDSNMTRTIKSNIPSEVIHTLRAIRVITRPDLLRTINSYYGTYYYGLIDSFRNLSGNPIIDDFLEKIVFEINHYPEFIALHKYVIPDLTYYIKNNKLTMNSIAVQHIEEILNPAKPEPVKEFSVNPTIYTGLNMINSTQSPKGSDCALTIISKASNNPCLFISLALLHKIINDSDESNKEGTKQIISAMIDSLKLGERGDILKKILSFKVQDTWEAAERAIVLDSAFVNK